MPSRWFNSSFGLYCLILTGLSTLCWGTTARAQAGIDLPALQRAISQTDINRRELAEALETLRRDTEDQAVRLAADELTLTATDLTVEELQRARLDIEALEARLQTLRRQLDRSRGSLRTLEQAIEADATRLSAAGEPPSLEDLTIEVAMRMRRQLHQIVADEAELLIGLRNTVDDQLSLARERLALLQARFDPGAVRVTEGFATDPRVAWLDRMILTLARDGVRLTKEAAAQPVDTMEQRALKRLLQTGADAAVLRANLRQVDRELLRIDYRLVELEALRDEGAVPVAVLRAARRELDGLVDFLDRSREEAEQALALLDTQRYLIAQRGDPEHSEEYRLITDLEQMLELHLADLIATLESTEAMRASYDPAVRQAFRGSLLEFQPLPLERESWQRLTTAAGRLPVHLYETLSGALGELQRLLLQAGQQHWVLLAGAALLLVGAVLWLRRLLGLWIAADPEAYMARPAAALRRGLPALLPAALWTVLALVLNIEAQTLYLVLTLLLVWPAAGFLLALSSGMDEPGAPRAHRLFCSRLRRVAVLVAVLAGLIILTQALVLPPGLNSLIDRGAMLSLLLCAYPALQLRSVLLASAQRDRRLWLRLLAGLAWLVPVLLAGTALIGLAGYLNLAWAVIIHLAWLVLIGVVLTLLIGLLWDWIDDLSERWQQRYPERGRFWVENFLHPLARLASLGLVLAGGRVLLDRIYNWDADTPVLRLLLDIGNAPLLRLDDSELTMLNLVLALLLVWLVFWVGGWSRQVSFFLVYQRIRDIGIRQSLATFTQYLVILAGILFTLRLIGFDLTALTVFAATLGVGIGFGLQNIVNNFISGILLLAERPLRLTDIVEVAGQTGEVTRIGIRSLTIKNFDQQEVIIPNSAVISDSFINWTRTDGLYRQVLMIGISYNDDPQQALTLIRNILQEYEGVCRYPAFNVSLFDFADSAVMFRVQYYIDLRGPVSMWNVRSEILRRIWYAFKEQGIQIPFPQRDVHLHMQAGGHWPQSLPPGRPPEQLPAT